MAKKTEKQYRIRILRPTRAGGESRAVGDELSSPKDITRDEAIFLLRIGKADPVEGNAKKTATKPAAETR